MDKSYCRNCGCPDPLNPNFLFEEEIAEVGADPAPIASGWTGKETIGDLSQMLEEVGYDPIPKRWHKATLSDFGKFLDATGCAP